MLCSFPGSAADVSTMLGSSLEALAMFRGSSVVPFMTDVARSFLVSASAECWPSSDISRFDSGSSNITNTDWIQGRMSRVSNGSYVMGWGPSSRSPVREVRGQRAA